MSEHNAKVYRKQGGEELVISSGGKLTLENGWQLNGAGLSSLVSSGLGASATYDETTSGAKTLMAASTSARVVLGIAVVDEAFDDVDDGTQPKFKIGETSSDAKFLPDTTLTDATLGKVFVFGGTLTANKALIVTGTPATKDGKGKISVTAIVLPASI